MTCKWLASDWLTALCFTVIIPIQLTETHRERKKEREGEGERGRRRGPLGSLWVSGWLNTERRAASAPQGTASGGPCTAWSAHGGWSPRSPCPGHCAPIAEPPDSGGALPRAEGLSTIRRPMHGGHGPRRSASAAVAFLVYSHRRACGSARPESGSSDGARPSGDRHSRARRSSRTYDWASGLW